MKKINLNLIPDIQQKKYPNITIAKVQEEFENNLKERQLRPATFRFYEEILNVFYKFKNYNDFINTIDQSTIMNFMKYCKTERNNGINTIHTNIRGLRTFLYFAMEKGYLPKFKIKVPSPDLQPKETYSKEDIQKLLLKPNLSKCNFSEYVAYVAVNIFVFTGMRLSTAINLKVEDIDLNNNIIYYRHTKNNKPHIVPLVHNLKEVVNEYLNLLSSQGVMNEYFLITPYGEQLTSNKLYKYISTYNKKRNVEITSIHAFRRFYIKSLVLQNVPIPKIQFLVQHKSPELITLYTKLYTTELVEDVERFSADILENSSINRKKIRTLKGGR
ncbi:hypothetical protein Ccar_16310 [Clostridium carboxidivorans P7]|uniref:tyrosine-type recombinase/integrase n=1 Tax=Clostridium carboxidivorans TaxID=217159 RepID=UPI00064E701C|nr:site-specific integrase [Clostridium carboxidivorans]AKN32341.1 hypothetical protein Ccar_16310 [Clostridium carboxidivorans P7]